ncbi:MAG: hypothetical protein RIC95_13340 [Vicingaceae bacterium]
MMIKFNFKKSRIAYLLILSTLLISESCSKEEINEDINSAGTSSGAYLKVPDLHFESILIEQGIDSDGTINQRILISDAEKVKTLDLNLNHSFGEISDLTGIEGFVNLTFLSAGRQEIESIDLSKNTLLDSLYLTANRLSTIDLRNNKELTFVDMQSNEFRSANSIIGLSDLMNLKELDLSWNYLNAFSIQNNSLEILHISHNDLKSINTTAAVNLKNIFMPSNKLETVDFSTNTLLETLLITGNNLQQLSLTNNSELTHLYVSANSLVSLDVSQNLELVDLRVDRNPNLSCIKIKDTQNPYVMKSAYQTLSNHCN